MTVIAVGIRLRRSMATFVADATVEERHDDSWVITENPVEQGSVVASNIYKLPADVVLTYAWAMASAKGAPTSPQNTANSPSFLQEVYTKLLQINAPNSSGVVEPFTIYTGKRVYQNMLMKNLSVTTDPKTENMLSIRATCHEILLVTTQTVYMNPEALLNPSTNSALVGQGLRPLLPGQSFNAGSTL